MTSLSRYFAPDGPLAKLLPGYAPRAAQAQMADAVADAIASRDTLVCEAGTGTGKTLAYLIPALLCDAKVVISTGTRHLQEQLYARDLPLAREAVKSSARTALLKGRTNYLCLHHLSVAELPGHFTHANVPADLAMIRDWAGRTRNGDISEMQEVPEDAHAWRYATATAESCLGQDCPHYNDCHVVKARRRALEADVLVVNHHLFFADMALKEDGFGELLPSAQAIVLDEAHQLPETATRFFGLSLTSGQLAELARDARTACRLEAGDTPELAQLPARVQAGVAHWHAALGARRGRIAWRQLGAELDSEVSALREPLATLLDGLNEVAERGNNLSACRDRCRDILARLDRLAADDDGATVRWLDIGDHRFSWHLSPLDVGSIFSAHVQAEPRAWVLTSATLAVSGRLEHFAARLGLNDARMEVWESPFDFRHQTLCFLPGALPEPRSAEYPDSVLEVTRAAIAASRGRAFLLYTSHRALSRAARALRETLDFPMFVQGDAPRSDLLQRFAASENGVLLGTYSFWEGVDVRGDALSLVLIDKLPFSPPDDPLFQARCEALRAAGEDPFLTFQLPQAVIALKQGVGRLIRDVTDSGVVVLCDPRLRTRGYGRVFLRSLPPMPRTERLADVQEFFDLRTDESAPTVSLRS